MAHDSQHLYLASFPLGGLAGLLASFRFLTRSYRVGLLSLSRRVSGVLDLPSVTVSLPMILDHYQYQANWRDHFQPSYHKVMCSCFKAFYIM